MTKLFTFFSLVLFSPMANFAQVQISDVEPEIGDQFTYESIESEFDPGASGANAIWDFSTIGNSEYSANYDIYLPEDAAGASYFPESSLAWVVTLDELFTLNFFMGYENDDFVEYGNYTEYEGFINTIINSDPLVRLNAPANYLDSSTDDYAGTLSLAGVGEYSFTGTVNYVVDAYGSIATPLGTYPNSLRINSIENEELEFIPGFSSITTNTTYMWYVEAYPVPILIIDLSQTYFLGELDEESYSLTYLSSYNGVALGVDELAEKKDLKIYPNPSSDFITFEFDYMGISELKILTLDGKNVQTQFLQSATKVDVSDLSPGYYIAEIIVDGISFSKAPFIINR